MSTHTSVRRHRVWTTTQSTSFISVLLRPCHRFAPLSPDKTCYRVILPAKVLRTQVHMSSRSSVQNHWHFEPIPHGILFFDEANFIFPFWSLPLLQHKNEKRIFESLEWNGAFESLIYTMIVPHFIKLNAPYALHSTNFRGTIEPKFC
jgi:hypothetical protein